MPPLHRLPNGTHLDLGAVSAIRLFPRDGASLDRVQIHHADGVETIPFIEQGNALAYADSLAALVNEARAAKDD